MTLLSCTQRDTSGAIVETKNLARKIVLSIRYKWYTIWLQILFLNCNFHFKIVFGFYSWKQKLWTMKTRTTKISMEFTVPVPDLIQIQRTMTMMRCYSVWFVKIGIIPRYNQYSIYKPNFSFWNLKTEMITLFCFSFIFLAFGILWN